MRNSDINGKSFNIVFVLCLLVGLLIVALPTIIIDPLFHYHAPLSRLSYGIYDERYQNNGIVRHFEYDALVTGSSMTENFSTTELNELFGVNSIKVPYAGSFYKEVNDNINVALENNPDIEMVVLSIDLYALVKDKDALFYQIESDDYRYPWYLIDSNFLTDVSYIFNKSILMDYTMPVIKRTNGGG